MNVLYDDRSAAGRKELGESHPDLRHWLIDHFSNPRTPYKLAFWAMVDNERLNGYSTRMLVWLDRADDEQAYFFEEALRERFGSAECLEFTVDLYPKQPVWGGYLEWEYAPETQCLPQPPVASCAPAATDAPFWSASSAPPAPGRRRYVSVKLSDAARLAMAELRSVTPR